jgi:hypothetical protein
VRSAARSAVRLILRAGEIARPVDLAHLLARHGLSLCNAHDTLQRLAAGQSIAVELQSNNRERLRSELSKFGVVARAINFGY